MLILLMYARFGQNIDSVTCLITWEFNRSGFCYVRKAFAEYLLYNLFTWRSTNVDVACVHEDFAED